MKRYTIDNLIKYKNFSFYIEKVLLPGEFDVHTHDFSELVIILKGTATHIIEGEEYAIKAGDVYIINGDTSHGFKDARGLELYNIMFDSRQAFMHNNDLKIMAGFQALFILEPYYRKEHKFNSRLQLSTAKLNTAEEILQKILAEFNTSADGCISMIRAYFTTFVVFLSREYGLGNTPQSEHLLQLAETIAFMENNYTEPMALQALAARACLSTRHFIRVFKQNYHLSPIEYVIQLRLKYACYLLQNKDANITGVSAEAGFTDSNYFSRQFKQKYGITPCDFRDKIFINNG